MQSRTKYYCLVLIIVCIFTLCLKIRNVLPYNTADKNISMMYIKIGDFFTKHEMYEEANFYYKVAMKISKKTIWLDYNIGKNIVSECWEMPQSSYKNDKLGEAIQRLYADLEKHPNHPNVLAQLGHAYMLSEDYDDAIHFYNLTLEQTPNWYSGLEQIAYCYQMKKDYKTSLKYYDEYLSKKHLSSAEDYFHYGWIYTEIKAYEKAIDFYKKSVEINPSKIESWINLSYVSELFLDDYENAIYYADKALEINNNSSYAISNKAYALICLKRYDEALPYVEKNLAKGHGRSYFQMGLIKFGQGDKVQAKYYMEKALKFEEKDPYGDMDVIVEKINEILKQCN